MTWRTQPRHKKMQFYMLLLLLFDVIHHLIMHSSGAEKAFD